MEDGILMRDGRQSGKDHRLISHISRPHLRIPLAAVSLLILAATAFRFDASWTHLSRLDHVSGAWITLATDLNQGVFYRPLTGADGLYGGTRFFPLYFSLHALIMRFCGSPFSAGQLMAVLSALPAILGLCRLFRQAGLSGTALTACLCFGLCAMTAQWALTTIRGDLLPAGLNLLGLSFFYPFSGDRNRRPAIWLGVLCFTAAFCTKVTSIHGAAAVCLFLFFAGRRREAVKTAALTAGGCVLAFLFFYAASEGRIWNILTVCASGGATALSILKSPWTFLSAAMRQDLPFFFFFAAALAALLSQPLVRLRELPALFFGVSLGLTVFIYGSPGIQINHLIDLHLASVLVLAPTLAAPVRQRPFLPAAVCLVAALFSLPPLVNATRYEDRRNPHRAFLAGVAAEISAERRGRGGPVLAEDPLVPAFAKEKIVLQDAFMFARMAAWRPEVAEELIRRIQNREFRAAVLMRNPSTVHPQWYREHFTPEVVAALTTHYRQIDEFGGYRIWAPRGPARKTETK